MSKKTIFTGLCCLGLYFCEVKAQQYDLDTHISLLEKGPAAVYVEKYWKNFAENDKINFPGWGLMKSNGELVSPLNKFNQDSFRIESEAEWRDQRDWIKSQFQKWILGSLPNDPDHFEYEILMDSLASNQVRHQLVLLKFGPDMNARMHFKLFIPPSEKPLPVFMTQWNHERWAYIAVRRGYIGCVYAGADSNDDAKNYREIYPKNDFSLLMARAWGAMRVVDYLYTIPEVDTTKIAITGHSRNGKQALIAAAFDDRIDAVLASTGAIGGGLPYRFTDSKFDSESIEDVFANFPDWFHPRLLYFMGNEDKLPVDQHHLAALIAPRSLAFASGYLEATSNMVGLEQMVKKLDPVYELFGEKSEQKVGLLTRNGLHGTAARDVERYVDFFDRSFGLKAVDNPLHSYYGFDNSKKGSTSVQMAEIEPKDLLNNAGEVRRQYIRLLNSYLGEEPPGVKNIGPGDLSLSRNYDDWVAKLMAAQDKIEGNGIGKMLICPYNSMGDYLFANLYYPENLVKENQKIPVVIFLHTYSTATGFRWGIGPFIQSLVQEGVAVLAFDQIGFGTRVEEGTQFEQRYPNWSRMGKMVSDVRGGIDALENFSFIDANEIYLAGNNMGSQLAVITSAIDSRVKGFMAYGGLGSLQRNEHLLKELSQEFGLIPFLKKVDSELPLDWPSILALNTEKKILIIDPKYDRHNRLGRGDFKKVFDHLNEIAPYFKRVQPEDWNRFRENQQIQAANWFLKLIHNP
ncbi:Acetyl xylan esterase (AXE1) [Algoriphagus faecimaris]|uniref:Acetyl xylan esterase (AXE1) n=1 Tax=Algoriphagus faecimaris TaxID=686796 RepID=A0A1G6XFX2_9BACT|nr:acetylxylan esterase [Algoriphagus faecimaris]SDD76962.1 Acetyl xylan esterase (AXE1) [Algoriphagus faecimaris]